MKRLFVLLLSLSLLFAVVGCGNKDENAEQPSDTVQTTEQTEKTTEATETNTTELTTAPATEPPTDATQSSDQSDTVEASIKEATDALQSKEWEDIEIIEGEPDSVERWGVVIKPYVLDEGSTLYSVIGHHNGISAVIRIVFDNDTSEASQVEVYYVAISGRTLTGDYLEDFLTSWAKPNEILSANDEEMYNRLRNSY